MTRRVLARLMSGAFIALLLAGCRRSNRVDPTSTLSAARPVVEEWLTCIECDAGQLDSVVAAAGRDPKLVDTLGQALLGAHPGIDAIDSQLRAAHADLVTEPTDGAFLEPLPSEEEFVLHYRARMLAVRRVRAAIAVARVGGPSAGGLLDSAAAGLVRFKADSIPADVRRKLAQVRARLRIE